MLAVIPEQNKTDRVAVLGFRVPEGLPRVSVGGLFRLWPDRRWRIWHARRNTDMLAGIILRHVLGFRFRLVFTSAALRRHARFTRWLYGRMDAIIATTSKAASYLDKPSTVVMHGVDTERFTPSADRDAAWRERAGPGRFGIGIFGRIRENKGTADFIHALLEVLPQRPDWGAVIVGESTPEHREFERSLRDRVAAAGLTERIRFIGFVPEEEIPRWYRSLTVVVCASRSEGFGLPCLEAMASGCAVLTTEAGAWPEIVRPGVNGMIVPIARPDMMARALLDLTADPARASEMGAAGRADVVDKFSISREAAGIAAVYENVLNGRGGVDRGG